MKQRIGIMVAAIAALVGGLGTTAHATILTAGGFPIKAVYDGIAYCVVTNTGTHDVMVNGIQLTDGSTGHTLPQMVPPHVIHPGETMQDNYQWSNIGGRPDICTFDVSTKTGVRASFALMRNGEITTVIPALPR